MALDENTARKLEARRKATYAAVRAARPDLYQRAVEIGHMALIDFGGRDEGKRSAVVESCVMSAIAEALDLEIQGEEHGIG